MGRVTGNVTSGARPRSAKKVTDIYIFFILTNDQISGDRR